LRFLKLLSVLSVLLISPFMVLAQGASVAFGDAVVDPNAPVEITADELSVDQNNGSAIFDGNVVAGQGEMRISAGKIRVQYLVKDGKATGQIDKLFATGGVTLVNGAEAAEASEAIYTVSSGEIEMTGDVILTQGPNALSGNKLIVDLGAGTGRMIGRVKTVFQTGNGN
jgi:lipopolysaccharide export system protein LptA